MSNRQELRPGWCHCVVSTYGAWLPGDPRGFRTRRHREHVEGDYKNPPPIDRYKLRHAASRRRLARPAVHLSAPARVAAVRAIRHALVEVHGIEVLAIAVGATHLHLIARFADGPGPDPVRHFVGIAKKESAKRLAEAGLVERGGVWAKRGKIVRVRDRPHQVRVVRYILEHTREGAAVWSFKDEKPTD